ncbi:MAG: FAD-dependent monooxygenase [Pseudomonadota bacterium]
MKTTQVLISGGGPVGLMTALELNYQGVEAILLERNPETTRHPKMDVTNGRSMELFRRLGLAQKLRDVAVPDDHPVSVIWCTNLAGKELTRFDYPSVAECRETLRAVNNGTMALEPGMRVSQILLEPVLKGWLDDHSKHVTTMFGWALESFEEDKQGVTATIRSTENGETQEIRCAYLAGCDGAGSVTRRALDIHINNITVQHFLDSGDRSDFHDEPWGEERPEAPRPEFRYMIHWTSSDLELFERFGTAWHIQSPEGWSIISQNDVDTWTIHIPPKCYPNITEADPKDVLFSVLGCEFDCEIKVSNPWNPRLGIADNYGAGRVWLAGDSTHQVIPTGGYGMNTGMGDALALGWVLAANVHGWGGPKLLEAYEVERRHVGARNRWASARHSSIRAKIVMACPEDLHGEGAEADASRSEITELIAELGNLENHAWGIEWGYRYDDSPVVCHDHGSAPPAYEWEHYQPSSWPGSRAPNVFLGEDQTLYDLFDRGFTLLKLGAMPTDHLEQAAAAVGMPIQVLLIENQLLSELYEYPLVLIRPDHHIAWRGSEQPGSAEAAQSIIDQVRGF